MHIRTYTIYLYGRSGSCLLYFGMSGRNKKEVLTLGRKIAKLWEDHYASLDLPRKRITVQAEEYKPKTQ